MIVNKVPKFNVSQGVAYPASLIAYWPLTDNDTETALWIDNVTYFGKVRELISDNIAYLSANPVYTSNWHNSTYDCLDSFNQWPNWAIPVCPTTSLINNTMTEFTISMQIAFEYCIPLWEGLISFFYYEDGNYLYSPPFTGWHILIDDYSISAFITHNGTDTVYNYGHPYQADYLFVDNPLGGISIGGGEQSVTNFPTFHIITATYKINVGWNIYVDGVKCSAMTASEYSYPYGKPLVSFLSDYSTPLTSYTSSTATELVLPNFPYIGLGNGIANWAYPFIGLEKDYMIFNKELTEEEVSTYYSNGTLGTVI